MGSKKEIKIDLTLFDEVHQYCVLNDIHDTEGYIEKLVREGHLSEKYGQHIPSQNKPTEVVKEKELETKVEEFEIPVLRKLTPPTKNKDIYGE